MSRTCNVLLAAMAAMLSPVANAVEPLLEKGTHELALHISPDFEGAIGDMTFVEAGYGWFVRDNIQLRATLAHTLLEDVAGPDGDYKMSELDAIAEYHFDLDSAFVPYVGVSVGWSKSEFNTVSESSLVYGPRAGLKYFLADNVALDVELAYRLASANVFINDFVAEDTDLSSGIGLRVLFGPSN